MPIAKIKNKDSRGLPQWVNLLIDNKDIKKTIKAEVSGDGEEATIYLYDAIDSWYGIGPQDIADLLAEITAKTIHLRINSPGGNVFDARAIKTLFDQHPAKIIAHIDGVAASAASWIFMDSEEIEISRGAHIMVHNSWTCVCGNAEDFLREATLLEKIDKSMRDDYIRRTNASESQVKEWMEAETWFDADEALEARLVDSIFEPEKNTEETAKASRWNLSAYKNAPKIEADEVEDNRAVYENRLNFYERVPA